MEFEYNKEVKADVLILNLKGELIDKNQATDFVSDIDTMIADGNKKFVLNLEQLNYMNSSGLNIIINMLTKSRRAGGDIAIAHVGAKIKQLLVITKLTGIFNVSESVESAIAKLN